MTDNQPDEESLSVLPIDAAQKSARDAPKGLRHVKLSNQPTELTWDDYYGQVSERADESPDSAATKQAMDEWLADYKLRHKDDKLSPWRVRLHPIWWRLSWRRYKLLRDVKRLAKRIEAREASK